MSHRTMIPRTATVITLALSALLLTSCASDGGGGGKKVSTHTPTPAVTAQATIYNKCVDGAEQVAVDKSDEALTVGDCDGINVITSDQAYTLGAVKVLTVEASGATIRIEKPGVEKIAVLGSNNTITYVGDSAPEITDDGEGNAVTAS